MAKRYAMVIDLHRCVGCAGCDIACKSENNVPDSFAWSDHVLDTSGVFPDVQYRYTPTLCNHCESAPCVTVPLRCDLLQQGCATRTLQGR
jgi:Fe-S-cluster-containing dehydrogenase component